MCAHCSEILIAFIELRITLNQLKRVSVAKIGDRLFFRSSGPEDTMIETDNFKVGSILATTFILFGKSALRLYSIWLSQGNTLLRSLEIACQV